MLWYCIKWCIMPEEENTFYLPTYVCVSYTFHIYPLRFCIIINVH